MAIRKPLAFRIRPKNIDEVVGQSSLVGKNGFLRSSIENSQPLNIIFYGTPGTGKTTIAEAYAKSLGIQHTKLNAVTCSKKDIEDAIKLSKISKNAFVIIDEVHRLNKDKQDILLPYVEEGDIFLLGMTTSNPYMAINKALRSRCHLLEVKPLSKDEIVIGLQRAIKISEGLNNEIKVSKDALEYIATMSNGDLRFALNYLEVIYISYKNKSVSLDDVKTILYVPNYKADDSEDDHYDSVSALQKSIRGSDVDASLYYLARLCVVQDLDSIKRRLLVIAYEDIGLANPSAVNRVHNAIEAAETVGFPEAIIPLGFAVAELALSPKSRASCNAIEEAVQYAENNRLDVLDYLKYTPVNVSEEDKYPYDRPDLWEKIQYLPEMIKNKKFYIPNRGNSAYEDSLNKNYDRLSKNVRSKDLKHLKLK